MFFGLIFWIPAYSVELYTENKNVTEVLCSENPELCKSCSAEISYEIGDLKNFEIKGYLSSTIDLVKKIISGFDEDVGALTWNLALNSKKFCISIRDFRSTPAYFNIFQDYFSLSYLDYQLPELDANSRLEQFLIISENGSGSGYEVVNLKIDYALTSAFLVYGINLLSKHKRIDLYKERGTVTYYGIAETETINPNFDCTFDYPSAMQVDIKIHTSSQVLLKDWYSAAYPSAGCEKLKSPTGLDSIHNVLVSESYLSFFVSSTLVLKSFNCSFVPPSFAVTQGVLLHPGGSFLTVVKGKCSVNLEGIWTNVRDWSFNLSAGAGEDYKMTAELADSPFELKLGDYEKIQSSFYQNYSGLFIEYSGGSSLTENLLLSTLENPRLLIGFSPEVEVLLTSSFRVSVSNDSYLKLLTGRKGGLISTVGQLNSTSFKDLLQVSSLTDPDFSIQEGVIELRTQEILINVSVQANCNQSAICKSVKEALPSSTLTGVYFPEYFFVSQYTGDILINTLELKNSQFIVDLAKGSVGLNGTTTLQLGELAEAVYDTWVLSSSKTGKVTGTLREISQGLLGCNTSFVFFSEFLQGFDRDQVTYSQVNGLCGFNGISDRWTGDLSLLLNDYKTDDYTCTLSPANISKIVLFLIEKTETDLLLNYVNFPSALSLVYDSDFKIQENIEILGLPAGASAEVPVIPNDLQFALTLSDFETGKGNIKVSQCEGSLNISKSFTVSAIQGTVSFWEINDSALISIGDEMSFNVSGSPFSGLYHSNISFVSPVNNFEEAFWTVSFELETEDLSRVSVNVSENLADWVLEGQGTLEQGLLTLYYYNSLVNNASSRLCTENCGFQDYCISEVTQKCTERAMTYSCSEEIASCDSNIICIQQGQSCLDDSCISSVSYCQKYSEICGTSNNTQCVSLDLMEIGEECLKKQYVCNRTTYPELQCSTACDFYQDIYNSYLDYTSMLNQSYTQHSQDLKDFILMDTENLFEILNISANFNLTQAGMTQNDFYLKVTFLYWKAGELELAEDYVKWDFSNEAINIFTITSLIKKYIVENSSNLASELIEKTPAEVYQESLYQID